jgi:hypothetical protein
MNLLIGARQRKTGLEMRLNLGDVVTFTAAL